MPKQIKRLGETEITCSLLPRLAARLQLLNGAHGGGDGNVVSRSDGTRKGGLSSSLSSIIDSVELDRFGPRRGEATVGGTVSRRQ